MCSDSLSDSPDSSGAKPEGTPSANRSNVDSGALSALGLGAGGLEGSGLGGSGLGGTGLRGDEAAPTLDATHPRPSLRPSSAGTLGIVSLLAAALALVGTLPHYLQWGVEQTRLNVTLIATAVAVVVATRLLMHASWQHLQQHRYLLIPLGLYLGLTALLGWAASAFPLLFDPFFVLHQPILLAVTPKFLISSTSALLFSAWTLYWLIPSVFGSSSHTARRTFSVVAWRVFVCSLANWLLVLGLASYLLRRLPLPTSAYLVGVACFAWNCVTAPLLITVVESPHTLLRALRNSLPIGAQNLVRWIIPIAAQLVIVGIWVFLSFSQGNWGNSTHISFNAFWLGGFEYRSRWLDQVAEVCGEVESAFVTYSSALLLLTLALLIKIHITRQLLRHRDEVYSRHGVLPTDCAHVDVTSPQDDWGNRESV